MEIKNILVAFLCLLAIEYWANLICGHPLDGSNNIFIGGKNGE